MKFYPEDVERLSKTILIGMPASGKSSINRYIAEGIQKQTETKMKSISTDERIQELAKDKENFFVQGFLLDKGISESDQTLLIKPSDFIAKYVDMLWRGELDGKIPDLGGKAMLHPLTAAAFRKQGYKCIYLDVDKEELIRRSLKDYTAWRGGKQIIRSNVNTPLEDAEKTAKAKWLREHPGARAEQSEDYRRCLDAALYAQASLTITDLLRERKQKYMAAATDVVRPSYDLEEDVARVMAAVRADGCPAPGVNGARQ